MRVGDHVRSAWSPFQQEIDASLAITAVHQMAADNDMAMQFEHAADGPAAACRFPYRTIEPLHGEQCFHRLGRCFVKVVAAQAASLSRAEHLLRQ